MSGAVSTWMGDRLGIPRVVGIFFFVSLLPCRLRILCLGLMHNFSKLTKNAPATAVLKPSFWNLARVTTIGWDKHPTKKILKRGCRKVFLGGRKFSGKLKIFFLLPTFNIATQESLSIVFRSKRVKFDGNRLRIVVLKWVLVIFILALLREGAQF